MNPETLPGGVPHIKAYLDPEGVLRVTDPGNVPYEKPWHWLQCLRAIQKDPNHSAVYGHRLGYVGGEDPYFYDPQSPEKTRQRPPTKGMLAALKVLSGLDSNRGIA